jgi:signal transduction histidine kinase
MTVATHRRHAADTTLVTGPLAQGTRAWLFYAVFGAIWAGVYLLLPRGGNLQVFWYQVLPISAFVAILVGIGRRKPPSRLAWYLIAAGQLAWVGGDLIWYVGRTTLHMKLGFPNAADALYLIAYPFLGGGLLVYMRSTGARQRQTIVETLVVTIGLGLISWVFFMAPVAHSKDLSFSARSVSLGYPLMDVFVLGVFIRLLFSRRTFSMVAGLLAASFAATLAADTAQLAILLKGSYAIGGAIDPFWGLGYVFLGAAALHPANSGRPDATGEADAEFSRAHTGLLIVGALLAPVAMFTQQALHRPVDVGLFAAAAAVMFSLVIYRISGQARSLRRMHEERSALLHRVMRAGEEERTIIAADLHDGPIQRLAALRIKFENPIHKLASGEIVEAETEFRRMGDDLGTEITRLRGLMQGLRPAALDQSGLAAALADLVETFSREHAMNITSKIAIRSVLSEPKAADVYRVVQEGLRNVSLHAAAAHVKLSVTDTDGELRFELEDDGIGFDPEAKAVSSRARLGIMAMRERIVTLGGTWRLESTPGKGTRLRATIPIETPSSNEPSEPIRKSDGEIARAGRWN